MKNISYNAVMPSSGMISSLYALLRSGRNALAYMYIYIRNSAVSGAFFTFSTLFFKIPFSGFSVWKKEAFLLSCRRCIVPLRHVFLCVNHY